MVDASKQIPRGLDESEKILGFDQSDAIVIVIGLFSGLVLAEILGSTFGTFFEAIGPLFIIAGLLIGFFIVFVTPNHLKSTEWLNSMKHHIFRPKVVQHVSLNDGMQREQKDKLDETKFYELGERTQDITWLHKVHRDANAIERVDEVLVGGIEVEPPNMTYASDAKWDQMINQWQSYVDNTVNYHMQVYVTSKDFPIEDHILHYQNRLNDPDIRQRPIIQELLRDFLDWYPKYLQYGGTKEKKFYLIFTVDETEVIGTSTDEKGVLEQMTDIPVIGDKIEGLVTSQQADEEDLVKAKMLAELNRRISSANGGVRGMPGTRGRTLSGFELAILLKEYWTGREVEIEEKRALTQTGLTARSDEPPVRPEELETEQMEETQDIL